MNYPGWNGFLGTRASFMMDFVCLAMAAILPVLWWSIRQSQGRRYGIHKRVQMTLACILLVAIAGFEIDARFMSNWTERATPSAYFPTGVYTVLYVHLVFSVSTVPLWAFVIVQALRRIPDPPGPSAYGRTHAFWGRLAAWDMAMTAVTGWLFYMVAFVA